MKKIIDIFFLVLIFIIIYFIQANFFSWFNIVGIRPNLFVVFIMMIGLFMKKECGFFLGIIFGILLDFFIGYRIGMNAVTFSIIGLASGYLDKNFSKDSRINIMIMTITMTIAFEIIYYILKIFLCGVTFELLNFVKLLSIEVIFNAFLIIGLYPILFWFGEKLEQDFIKGNTFLNFF